MRYRVSCLEHNIVLADNMKKAESFFSRLIGLMFSKEMNGFDGLLISPCYSIHTCFMKFPIDVLFLDKTYKVIKIQKNLKPWRMTRAYFKASQVLELAVADKINSIDVGDTLEVVCIN